jgi:hypothetical protein
MLGGKMSAKKILVLASLVLIPVLAIMVKRRMEEKPQIAI